MAWTGIGGMITLLLFIVHNSHAGEYRIFLYQLSTDLGVEHVNVCVWPANFYYY